MPPQPGGRGWANGYFVRTALPMMGFVLFGWLGISQLVQSKLDIRVRLYQRCYRFHLPFRASLWPCIPKAHVNYVAD